jgi:hypothetical protein
MSLFPENARPLNEKAPWFDLVREMMAYAVSRR